MQPHQQRVINERSTLVTMLDKLKTFINEAPEFKDLPIEEQNLLHEQRHVMGLYAHVLARRISIFPPEPTIAAPSTPAQTSTSEKQADAPIKK